MSQLSARTLNSTPVLHVLWSLERWGGAERSVYQLAREQRRRGLEAGVMVANSAGAYGELLRREEVPVYELGQKQAFDTRPRPIAENVLSKYGVIHFHGIEPLLLRWAVDSDRYLAYSHRSGVFSYPLRRSMRYGVGGFYIRRYFGAVSANTKTAAIAAAKLLRLAPETVCVVYNGIDFSLLAPRRPAPEVLDELGATEPGVLRVGTAANLRAWKRIDLLLRALPHLTARHRVQCIIIGNGPARADLERLARDLGVADRVVFVGKSERIGDYLQVLDIFTLPSGPQESFGNAAVEAMGVGIPTVVFEDGGGLLEHITHGETGLVATDQADFVRQLDVLLSDPNARLRLGTAARVSARHRYTLEAMVLGYERLYGRAARPEARLVAPAGRASTE
jgi:glycosyltransferase involved in cell wall biosynthesis